MDFGCVPSRYRKTVLADLEPKLSVVVGGVVTRYPQQANLFAAGRQRNEALAVLAKAAIKRNITTEFLYAETLLDLKYSKSPRWKAALTSDVLCLDCGVASRPSDQLVSAISTLIHQRGDSCKSTFISSIRPLDYSESSFKSLFGEAVYQEVVDLGFSVVDLTGIERIQVAKSRTQVF